MYRSIQLKIASAILAAAALGSAAAATPVQYVVQAPPQTVYVQDRGIAVGEPYPGRYERYRRDRRDRCGAARWDPQVRYMPGNLARIHGKVYAATRISARVYNVNSPPDVTPNYWVRVRCN